MFHKQYETYTITNVNMEHFQGSPRITASSLNGSLVMDVHHHFLKFFKEPIGSNFKLCFTSSITDDHNNIENDTNSININEVSYITKGVIFDIDKISFSGLLLQLTANTNKISDNSTENNYVTGSKFDEIYCIIKT